MKKPCYFERGQKVAVLGAGRTGAGAADLLLRHGAEVFVYEAAGDSASFARLEASGAKVRSGVSQPEPEPGTALAVLSPGIPPESEFAGLFFRNHVPVISEIELAWSVSGGRVVAITGTNGKTTTTGLMEAAFNRCKYATVACGNIGLSFSEAVERHPEASCYAVEVSSFQLETCHKFRPDVAVWTNFSPNHLDRYRSVEDYFSAKARIFMNQCGEDRAVVPKHGRVPETAAGKITFSATDAGADFSLRGDSICYHGKELLEQSGTRLPGAHNAENIMAVLGAGSALGLDMEALAGAVCDFSPPEHRCEFVAEINGVRFVNDSKSTNLDALEKALTSFSGPLVLIAGGKDKGFGFEPLADVVRRRVERAVLIGEMRHKIAGAWSSVNCEAVDSLEEAVRCASRHARSGSTVLFSPGTSSFDMFRDYEARGSAFKAAVLTLRQQT